MIGDDIQNDLLCFTAVYFKVFTVTLIFHTESMLLKTCDQPKQGPAIQDKTATDSEVNIHARPPVASQQHLAFDNRQSDSHISVQCD